VAARSALFVCSLSALKRRHVASPMRFVHGSSISSLLFNSTSVQSVPLSIPHQILAFSFVVIGLIDRVVVAVNKGLYTRVLLIQLPPNK
jgi:hypothetical protein